MWTIIGALIVFVSVVGGYILEKGNLSILIQPVELLIIFGAAGGALVISAGSNTKAVLKAALGTFSGKHIGKEEYLQYLSFFYEMSMIARKEGLLALEAHVETPAESVVFKKYSKVTGEERMMDFICENIKLSTFVKMESKDLDVLIDIEIDAILSEEEYPASILTKIGDSLPGLGIVAAVLGVILTMGYVSESAEVIGHHVAVALVGTFCGIFACYGFVGPIASNIEHYVASKAHLYNVIKVCILTLVTGVSPAVLIEYGRRAVPPEHKPTVAEIEEMVSKGGGE